MDFTTTNASAVGTPRPADATAFRDLNGNGVMDPYEDPSLPIEGRVEDLLSRLSLAEKAGLMVQSVVSVTVDGSIDGQEIAERTLGARELIGDRLVTHLNVHRIPDPRSMARWNNELQRLAEQTPHGIPVTISTDPRHSFTENWGASFSAEHLSAWPEPLGLGALGDEATVREFADIARREYAALGIRLALHPTLDVATEPRWARQYSTFGQDAEKVAELGVAYVDGFEGGDALGPQSISCMAKHFPGGGPQRDGEDPHFHYGKEQDYLGGMFEYHLEPFRRVIERGVPAIMPSYGIPIGLHLDGEPVEEVGFGFNRQIITGLLRERLGFQGVVCTDWGLVTESRIGGKVLPARAWGVEHLSEIERVQKIIDAGCDQLGGEEDPSFIVSLVESGAIDEARIDESVRPPPSGEVRTRAVREPVRRRGCRAPDGWQQGVPCCRPHGAGPLDGRSDEWSVLSEPGASAPTERQGLFGGAFGCIVEARGSRRGHEPRRRRCNRRADRSALRRTR